jgi:hypothetical protein
MSGSPKFTAGCYRCPDRFVCELADEDTLEEFVGVSRVNRIPYSYRKTDESFGGSPTGCSELGLFGIESCMSGVSTLRGVLEIEQPELTFTRERNLS